MNFNKLKQNNNKTEQIFVVVVKICLIIRNHAMWSLENLIFFFIYVCVYLFMFFELGPSVPRMIDENELFSFTIFFIVVVIVSVRITSD